MGGDAGKLLKAEAGESLYQLMALRDFITTLDEAVLVCYAMQDV